MMSLILAMLLQSVSPSSQAWKERNQPDMLVFPPCALDGDVAAVDQLGALPVGLVAEMTRYFEQGGGLADAHGRFNSTDVVSDHAVPRRRFLRAYHVRDLWVIWYERGGIGRSRQTLAFRRDREVEGQGPRYQPVAGTVFSGADLCLATTAIVAGLRSNYP